MLQFDNKGLLIPNEVITSDIDEFKNAYVFNEQRADLYAIYLRHWMSPQPGKLTHQHIQTFVPVHILRAY